MKDIIKIFALGGLDENGKNMYIIEINDDIFVLDAGLKFPESSTHGVDIIIPDYTYLKDNKNRIRAFIITHGHDDLMGALPYIIENINAPVYCSEITKHLILDVTRRFKLNINYNFKIIKPTEDFYINNRLITAYKTTHSVWDSFGIAIDTDQGKIIYTSDFIFDYGALNHYATDLKTLSKFSEIPVLCLLTDSQSAEKPGHASPNHKLTPLIERVFQEEKGRIIIALYSQNLYAIREAIDLTLKYHKKICFYSNSMNEIIKRVEDMKVLNIPSESRITINDLYKKYDDGMVIFVTGNGTKLFRTIEKICGDDLDRKLIITENDHIIIAAPPVPGNEIIASDSINELYRTGARITNISRKKIASMHPHQEDLKMIISLIRPKYYMPVKGDFSSLLANAKVAVGLGYNHNNVLVYDNGYIARFENGKLNNSLKETILVGDLMVDGLGVGDVGSIVITDRDNLGSEGIIIIAATIDRISKTIISSIDIQARGLVFLKDSDEVIQTSAKIYEDNLESSLRKPHLDLNTIKSDIREKIARYIKKEIGKEPMILPVIIEI